ncbi:MAG TPA: TonB-dependent receptor [Terriglobales bacterium]
MQWSRVLLSIPFLLAAASAGEIKIKVADPQSAAVSGAQVQLFRGSTGAPAATGETSGDGEVVFNVPAGNYHARVAAQGFALRIVDIKSASEITVQLDVASASETVVVTASRTPLPVQSSGASVDTLNGEQLQVMRPVASSDAIRFLPGAVINTAGQQGGLASLFVRGGDSTYNKVIVDGVTINEPGGTFNFGNFSMTDISHLEFLRGAQSTLYGSDAMTSVVQMWTDTGSTAVPELRFGADGGNFGTAHGFASVSGARGRFDYDAFGDQFYTNGQGINNDYSNASQGGNIGFAVNDEVSLRLRVRNSNSFTGLSGEWGNFNGTFIPPNPDAWSQLKSLLGSLQLTVNAPSGWQHRLTGFDYNYQYTDVDQGDPARLDAFGDQFDLPSHEVDHINRVGFEYQGDYSERSWTHTTFGYRLENENGFIGDLDYPPQTHGQRLNQDFYGQQQISWKRFDVVAGARFVHSSVFGNIGIPRVAATFLAWRGNSKLSGTRLRFSYSGGFKEPRLEETFAGPPYTIPNPSLLPERNRAFDTGFLQNLFNDRFVFSAIYFNNLFTDQINYVTVNPVTFVGEYVNVNKAFAQGAELGLQGKIDSHWTGNLAYTYTSTEILDNPAPINSLYDVGMPLLRRPKHSATALINYLGSRWAGNVAASYVGRRPDSDFLGYNVNYAAGYVRMDLGGWYAITRRITAYANISNVLDRHYWEVVGYPAVGFNFRTGLRFRIGGE